MYAKMVIKIFYITLQTTQMSIHSRFDVWIVIYLHDVIPDSKENELSIIP